MAKKKDDKDKDKNKQGKGKSKGNDKPKKSNPKKKRKVGRPKKRGRKKKYYKKKKRKTVHSTKGFGSNVSYNRVRALLWKTHKDDFASYRDFISNKTDSEGNKIKGSSIVSQVYDQCKTIECSDEDILLIYNQFKGQDREGDPPIIPDDYYMPRPYYELVTEDLWDGLDDRLWVYSPMLLSPPPFFLGVLGEDRCIGKDNQIKDINSCDIDKGDKFVKGKKERFTPFVNYCNQFQQQGIYTTSEEVPHVRFIGKDEDNLEPYWNESTNRWEIQIVPCTPFGDTDTYGFNPLDIDPEIPDEDELPTIEKPLEPETPPTEDTDKAITLEKEKQKTLAQQEKTAQATAKAEEKKAIADITAMWRKGDIDTKEMKELIQIIKS